MNVSEAIASRARLQRRIATTYVVAGAVAVGGLLVAGHFSEFGRAAAVETFVLIFTSIVVEALPFVLVGALVSALIEVFVPDAAFTRVARLPLGLQVPGAALGGLAFPVCECGSVPVARRLIARGMHPSAALAFMLASPVINPVVLASTWVAYQGRGVAMEMLAGRATLGIALAAIAGWAIGTTGARELLRPRAGETVDEPTIGEPPRRDRGRRLVEHLASDFFFMARFIVIGSALAALMQTALPQSIVSSLASTPLVAVLALMGLAFVLSLCSEADAFVAVSFVQFPLSSQLGFLVFGPVVDIKLAFLYGATFRRGFVTRLVVVSIPVVLAGTLWFEVLMR